MPGNNQSDADAVFDAAATKVQAVLRGATARKRSVAGVRLSPSPNPNPSPSPSPDPDPNPSPSPNQVVREVGRGSAGKAVLMRHPITKHSVVGKVVP